ncbi:dubious [Schizosaccharomyces pombe]|uniref:Uncharacterized protein C24B11.14 n=1 Tax=Schizosaccharomyces pombe (strain 972 / ATCC 24843) TaxID=284812 RepID=YAIE_SCHPO|nr:uncharacterized protein SPAC24B11.14 [Schizosaccharomyces pombe]Q9UR21.1 RecName: Full=Uncharacterized protein C24B11.14 [Schizosaccharomyces pombe 972h-]CAB61651.1 dubious [Schizosaccharomyces pombe]|eukprot:NP_001342929.1 uncharacterized protein SPAC24B11.14 [Schizosaccharomyces pombe]
MFAYNHKTLHVCLRLISLRNCSNTWTFVPYANSNRGLNINQQLKLFNRRSKIALSSFIIPTSVDILVKVAGFQRYIVNVEFSNVQSYFRYYNYISLYFVTHSKVPLNRLPNSMIPYTVFAHFDIVPYTTYSILTKYRCAQDKEREIVGLINASQSKLRYKFCGLRN